MQGTLAANAPPRKLQKNRHESFALEIHSIIYTSLQLAQLRCLDMQNVVELADINTSQRGLERTILLGLLKGEQAAQKECKLISF